MELQSSGNIIIVNSFRQIKDAISQLIEWNSSIYSADDYLYSPEGKKNLAASSMLLEAIGEGIKKIDRKTNKGLLILRPEIPWEAIMGMRDHIAHGYFDIDAELIFDTIKNDLNPLLEAIEFFIEHLKIR